MMKQVLRSFALLSAGAVGVATLLPADDTANAVQPSLLAPAPQLSRYLDAQLSSVADRREARIEQQRATLTPEPRPSAAAIPAKVAATISPKVEQPEAYAAVLLNVRSGPDKHANRQFVLQPGTSVTIAETNGSWARIHTADGKSGWAYRSYLTNSDTTESDSDQAQQATGSFQAVASEQVATSTMVASALEKPLPRTYERSDQAAPKADFNQALPKAKAFRLANNTVIRSSPSRGSEKLATLRSGSKLLVTEWEGSWARVIASDGTSGWINVR